MAGREHLDNLIFVVNCNLQRLDGPVRGNGKIIQELEALFRGAGWNVIKVIWGSRWDELLARDVDGVLVDKMNTTVDGEFQKYAVESGAYIREHFFGPDPRLRKTGRAPSRRRAAGTSPRRARLPQALRRLQAGHRADGAPTAILAKTIKGWTLGPEIEARNATHQIKKMTGAAAGAPGPPLPDRRDPRRGARRRPAALLPPADGSDAHDYLMARRKVLARPGAPAGGAAGPPALPDPKVFADFSAGSGGQAVSTTMAFARMLRNLVRDPAFGPLVVPIVADEARTFGLEPIIAESKIYAPEGQRYTPVDAGLPLAYAESPRASC